MPEKTLTPLDIRRAAMDYLARREHAFDELVGKLLRRFKAEDAERQTQYAALIAEQVTVLASENLQSDQRYVESFINGRKAQGKGPLRIRQELEYKGISSQLIEEYLHQDDASWLELAQWVYHKKFGSTPAASYQEKSKRLRFMQYRGFSYQHLSAVID